MYIQKTNVKKLTFVIRYVPDRYNTQQMCHTSIIENGGKLESFPILLQKSTNV